MVPAQITEDLTLNSFTSLPLPENHYWSSHLLWLNFRYFYILTHSFPKHPFSGKSVKSFPQIWKWETQTVILANSFSLICLKMKITTLAPHPEESMKLCLMWTYCLMVFLIIPSTILRIWSINFSRLYICLSEVSPFFLKQFIVVTRIFSAGITPNMIWFIRSVLMLIHACFTGLIISDAN